MGKGQIISGGTDGQYQVKVMYNRERYEDIIAALNTKKEELIKNRVPVQADYDDKSLEVDNAVVELGQLIDELADLFTDLEALQVQLAALRLDLTILEAELKALQEQEPPAWPQDIIDKQNEIADKKIDISDKQTEISDKQKEIAAKQTEIEEKQKEVNSLSFELLALEQQLAEIDLRIASIEKRVQYLEENMPADDTVSAWCADLTEDLTGYIGTVEVPGERGDKGILQIQPGYAEDSPSPAIYEQTRDGQLFANVAVTPAQAFYNAAMLPGWQKWQPIFRHGTISSISEAGKANVTLLSDVTSSAQDLNIDPVSSLGAVDFDYMNCDHEAFTVGDEVLIKFTIKASMTAQLAQIATLKSELMALLKELAILRNDKTTLINTDLASLTASKAFLQDELSVLLEADPQDPAAIAAKQVEIAAKQVEIDNKEAEITAQEGDISDKQDEIDVKKAAIKSAVDNVAGNMEDFAEPTIVGFKDNPKGCAIIFPYMFASELSFTKGGLLLYESTELDDPFEIFSPYGDISDQPTYRYQPHYWTDDEAVEHNVEWQVKEFTDDNGLWWDEIKWMTNGGYDWDPTFYETYESLYDEEKPYSIQNAKTKILDNDPGDYGYPCQWHGDDQIKIITETGSEVLVAAYYRQWNVGDVVDGWHNEGTSISMQDGCLDQTDTSKYAFVYTSRDYVQTGRRVASLCVLDGDTTFSNSKAYFVGLGFEEELPFAGATELRLYNINGQYVCLFSISSGDKALIGCAVEDGEFTIVNVTDGIYFNGEYRDLFPAQRPIMFGFIQRSEGDNPILPWD